jgi:hypothetical protein
MKLYGQPTFLLLTLMAMLMATPLWANGASWSPDKHCPKIPPNAAKAQMAAGNAFARAESNYQSGKPMKALKGFLCSHRIMQHENTLFNIAQIAKLEEQQAQAVVILETFVESVESKHVVEPIAEILADIAEPAESSDATSEPADAPEEPSATVDAPSEPSASSDDGVGVSDDSDEELETPAAETETLALEVKPTRKGKKIAGVVMLSVGIASLATGALFQGFAGNAKNSAEATDQYDTFQAEEEDMKLFQAIGISGFAAGGVLVAVGAIVLGTSGKKESNQQAHLVVSPKFSGVSLQRSF